MATEPGLQPLDNPPLPRAPDETILVIVRKVGDNYVADPERVRIPKGRCANVVFVLQDAPENAELHKMTIQEHQSSKEHKSSAVAYSNPFSLPGRLRVMLLTDDNTAPAHHGRKFDYILQVREGTKVFEVDPGIDHDPPPPPP